MKTSLLCLLALLNTTCLLAQAPKLPKAIKKEFTFIPAGTAHTETQKIQTYDFWIATKEVSNQEYNTFLDVKKMQPDPAYFSKVQRDTAVWNWHHDIQKTYGALYGTHPAFASYPVVGISKFAAEAYCQWLNKTFPVEGWKYRLPTREEWMRAAQGKHDYLPYPWGKGPYEGVSLVAKNGKYRCNFADWHGLENMHATEASTKTIELKGGVYNRDGFDFPAYGKAYLSNDYGLYNMLGNVSELVSDQDIAVGGSWKSYGYDVRVESFIPYAKPSDAIGFRPVLVKN
jgi:formylglycine-generating enzyme required for sulfatase activity